MTRFRLLSLTLALLACADAPGDGAVSAQVPDSMVVSDDPELKAMALEMLPDLARRSGLELQAPVRLERRSRSELEAYLRYKLDQDLPPRRAERMVEVYSRLGLMPGDLDLRGLFLSVYREQVAGFYDPDSTALFVMEDQPAETLQPILLHELVHAVQDQAMDLSRIIGPEVGNDRATAAQAAIEGQATLVMMEYMTEALRGGEVDLTEIPGFADQMRSLLAAAGDQYPELSRAPRVIQEGVLLPYIEGAGFVLEVWRSREGRDHPLESLLPASTEQVLDPARFLSDPPDDPTAITLTVTGGEVVYEDGLGMAETRILLEEHGGPDAGSAATGWDGDRYALVEGVEGTTLVWVSVWDDVEARDRFVATLAPFPLGDASHGESALEALEVEGRPAALLRVGPGVEGVEIRLGGTP